MKKFKGLINRMVAMSLSGMLIIGSASGSVFASSTDAHREQISEVVTEDVSSEEEVTETPMNAASEQEAQYYTVTLDANGGYFANEWDDVLNESIERTEILHKVILVGGTVTAFPVMEQENMAATFMGWSIERDGEIVSQADVEYIPVDNCVLYAVWKVDESAEESESSAEKEAWEDTDNRDTEYADESSDQAEELETDTTQNSEDTNFEDGNAEEASSVDDYNAHESVDDENETPNQKDIGTDQGTISAEKNKQEKYVKEAATMGVVASGTCGDNLTWTLDEGGTLTIIGTGEIYSDSSWEEKKDEITKVIIGDGVISIGSEAFEGCTALENVSFPDGLKSIGSKAFSGCDNLKNISLPKNIEFIGCGVFTSQYITSITIPKTMKSMGSGFYYGYSTFTECKKLETVSFESGMTKIPDNALYCCESVKNVIIPEGVTEIGERSLRDTGIVTLSLPTTLELIDAKAIWECSLLKSIVIPSKVTSIGSEAFEGCEKLAEIFFYGNAPFISSNAFTNVTAIAYYPANDSTWTEEIRQNYGGSLTWEPWDPEGLGYNHFFKLGEDTNQFYHHEIPYIFNDDSIKRKLYLSTLLTFKGTFDLYKYLDGAKGGKGGVCHGIALSMCYGNQGLLDFKSITSSASNYWELGDPQNNPAFKDLLLYYTLTQLSNGGEASKKLDKGGWHLKSRESRMKEFLIALVGEAQKCSTSKKPFVFGFKENDGGGHSVVVCGYIWNKETRNHEIIIYDENSYNGEKGEYYKMSIPEDCQTFDFADANARDAGYTIQDVWESLYIYGIDKIYGSENILKNSAVSSNSSESTITFQVSAGKVFRIEDEFGNWLSYDGTNYLGNMNVYECYTGGLDDSSYWNITVDATSKLILTDFEQGCELCTQIDGKGYAVSSDGADSITIQSNKVTAEGESYLLDVSIQSEKYDIIQCQASTEGTTMIVSENDSFVVSSTGDLGNVKAWVYDQAETEEYNTKKDKNGNVIIDFEELVNSNKIIKSGKCEGDVSWKLDSNGKLTISGTGAIPDYFMDMVPHAPWLYENVKKVVIGDGITRVGNYSFYGMKSLEGAKLPSALTQIGWGAFEDCKNLKTVNIPSALRMIDGIAFHGTAWLAEKRKQNPYVIINGILIDGEKVSGDEIDIPENVKIIGPYAFVNKFNYSSVYIPEGVESIGQFAFSGNKTLSSVFIPSTVNEIGTDAFDNWRIAEVQFGGTPSQWEKLGITSDNNYSLYTADKKSFTRIDITKATVTGLVSKTYTSKAITQTPTVKISSTTLKLKKDFVLDYKNNTNAGTATITINGIGDYTGTVSRTFIIARATQSLSVKTSAASVAVGKTITMTASGAKETNDYSYTSSNTKIATVSTKGVVTGKSAGTVTITIKTPQTQNYNAASKTIKITVTASKSLKKPGNCHFAKWNNSKYTSCRISWNKVDGAEGYETLLSWTNGSNASRTIVKSNILYRDCTVHPQHVSQMMVRAFYMSGGKRVFGPWSNVEYITPSPTKLTTKNASSGINLKMNISWIIIYGCNGYNVFLTTNPNGTWYWNQSTSTKADATGAAITKYRGSKLKKNTRYYVRIVTRRQRNGVFCTVPMPANNTYIGSFIIK